MKHLQKSPLNRHIDLTIEPPSSGYDDLIAMFRIKPSALVAVRVGGEDSQKAAWRVRAALRYKLGVEKAREFIVEQTVNKRLLLVRKRKV